MKLIKQLVVLAVFSTLLTATAIAQAPGEQLRQMVEQLQKTPDDNALREKIIKLAVEMKPAPALPEEATRRMARGEAAFESAKDSNDYDKPIAEYQAAANAAPWYADAYFNLGLTQEKANKAKDAMESFRFYLLAAPDAKDTAEIKKRLYKLEYSAEQQSQAAAENAKQRALDEAAKQFEVGWQKSDLWGTDRKWHVRRLDIKHGTDGSWTFTNTAEDGGVFQWTGVRDVRLVGSELTFILDETIGYDICGTYEIHATISADGNKLSLAYKLLPFVANRALRCPLVEYYGSHVDEYTKR